MQPVVAARPTQQQQQSNQKLRGGQIKSISRGGASFVRSCGKRYIIVLCGTAQRVFSGAAAAGASLTLQQSERNYFSIMYILRARVRTFAAEDK